jgi:hypothetical protein
VADAIARTCSFQCVAVSFLEEPPFLEDALAGDHPPTIVSGFFFGDGLHAGEDVPAAISVTGARAVYAGPVGSSGGIPALISRALLEEVQARTLRL